MIRTLFLGLIMLISCTARTQETKKQTDPVVEPSIIKHFTYETAIAIHYDSLGQMVVDEIIATDSSDALAILKKDKLKLVINNNLKIYFVTENFTKNEDVIPLEDYEGNRYFLHILETDKGEVWFIQGLEVLVRLSNHPIPKD